MGSPSCTLNGLVIDNTTLDGNGTAWQFISLDGWWDSTPIRVATQETQPAGEVVTVARENGRPLVLTAIASTLTPNTTKLGKTACFQAIATAKDAGRCVLAPVLLTVVDPIQTLHALVQRNGSSGTLKSQILGESHSLMVTWQLFAPDPNRYDVDNNPFD